MLKNKSEPSINADNSSEIPKSQPGRSGGVLSRPSTLISLILLGIAFFGLTSPKAMPSVVLIAGFVVLGVVLYATLKLIGIVTGLENRLSTTSRRGLMLFLTLLPVLLLVMQSIGQLTIRDVVTFVGVFSVGVFYVTYIRRSS